MLAACHDRWKSNRSANHKILCSWQYSANCIEENGFVKNEGFFEQILFYFRSAGPSLPYPRAAGVLLHLEGRAHSLGGQTEPNSLVDTTYALRDDLTAWDEVPEMRLPWNMHYFSAEQYQF